MTRTLDNIITKLTGAKIVSPATLVGCTDEEIASIEASAGVKLPATYRAFLAKMGRSAGTFLQGTDFLFPDLLTLKAQAQRLLRESKAPVGLDAADFVFAVHQGYTFVFFKCGTDDDPPVFVFEEGDTSFRPGAESFSAWLAQSAADEVDAEHDLAE